MKNVEGDGICCHHLAPLPKAWVDLCGLALGICVQGFGSLYENDTKSSTVNLADDKIQLLPHAASEFRQRRNWSAGGARRTA